MTTDEIKAAAERLRRWDAGERASAIYPHPHDPIESANNDAWDLAREYRKRLAADERQAAEDAEPITHAWLVASGWKDDGNEIASTKAGRLTAVWSQLGLSYGTVWIDIDTRDRLRKLLEALKGGDA
jgi:hypothetical protein